MPVRPSSAGDLFTLRQGEERQIRLGAYVFTVVRRSSDYIAYLGGERKQFEADRDPLRALGALLVTCAEASAAPQHYDWQVRWHLPDEAECARSSRFSGIERSTKPESVWQMVKTVHPTAFCDEIINLTLEDKEQS